MSDKPNIIVIMVDDMGFSDIGCYGGEIETPNLDRLAAGGVRFTNFYNCARCCPTRASLLTGLYPHQAGIGHMTAESPDTRGFNQDIDDDGYQGWLNDQCVTIPEVLQTAGYRTYMSGKWHVGTDRPRWPMDRGVDRYYGIIRGASNHFRPEDDRLLVDGETHITPDPGFYTSDAFSEQAVRFIDEHEGTDPFFLYLAFTAPHWPLHAWPEDIARYRGKYLKGWDALREQRFQRQMSLGLFDQDVGLSPRDDEAPPWDGIENPQEWDLRMAVYAAMIDRVDQGIGRVIDSLEVKGELDNTLILFLSDNGACAESHDPVPDVPPGPQESGTGVWLPWANASNTPFKLFKHWTHEGGINTPLVAHWPAGLGPQRAGTIQRTYAAHVKDIMATCLEVAGAEYPAVYRRRDQEFDITPLEGHSFLGALSGETDTNPNTIFWEHEGNQAVRQGSWKLVSWYSAARGFAVRGVGKGCRAGAWELYNLADDPTELDNRAKAQADKAESMMADYDAYAKRTGVKDWEDIQRTRGTCASD